MTSDADLIIVGGGPAGMMAGLLFARAGCNVRVLEKHADFFRDFRGDTVHPSTMEILDQLGMLKRFLKRPHNRIDNAQLNLAGRDWTIGDLSHLDTAAPTTNTSRRIDHKRRNESSSPIENRTRMIPSSANGLIASGLEIVT